MGNVFVFKFVNKMKTSHFHTTFRAIAFLIISKKTRGNIHATRTDIRGCTTYHV